VNAREFERRFLDLVFRTNLRLTPHVVAYRLGLPFAETKEQLDRLAKAGVAEVEVDAAGVLYYEVPGVERPSRDLDAEPPPAPKPPPPKSERQAYGQYFTGPAAYPPPPKPVYVSAPRQTSPWMWLPLMVLGGYLGLHALFAMIFFFQDIAGLAFFFFLGFVVVRAFRGRSCAGGSQGGYSCRGRGSYRDRLF
jgi:hypothetical protein